MDKAQYIAMCNKILDNEDWYKRIPLEHVSQFQDEFNLLLLDSFHQRVITKDLYEALLVKYPVTPTFYSLPKTHKDLVCPPSR